MVIIIVFRAVVSDNDQSWDESAFKGARDSPVATLLCGETDSTTSIPISANRLVPALLKTQDCHMKLKFLGDDATQDKMMSDHD